MKIRNGFVSNSSSSSFIIGIAGISEDKLEEAQSVGLVRGQYTGFVIIPQSEVKHSTQKRWPILRDGSTDCFGPNTLYVDSFNDTSVVLRDSDKYDYIVYYTDYGSEPYWDDEENCYIHDESLFSKKQIDIGKWIEAQGGRVETGSGFNG